jgi:hypothetical protein
MPRPPKPESLDNPLRRLRELLGTAGKPMPQHKLSETLGVPVETLKSIENNRFRGGIPGEALMERISIEFGAVWTEKDKEWQLFPKTPFTQRQYKLWQTASFDRVTEIDALCGALIYLLQQVPDRRFASASDAVFRKLSELANQYGVSTAAREFLRSDLMAVPVWRDGKETRKAEDVVGFERQRDYLRPCQIPDRERLDYRFKAAELPAASSPTNQGPFLLSPAEASARPVKRSSRPRSKRVSVDGAPRTSRLPLR